MNNHEKQLNKGKENLKMLKMTPEEARVIFHNVTSHNIETTSIRHISVFTRLYPVRSLFQSRHLTNAVFASVFILILGSGSLIASSNGSLPGDILYPIKVRVAEPLRDFVAFSPEGLAELQQDKSIRRLQEAEILASQHKLVGENEVQLQSLLEEHLTVLDRALERATKVSKADTKIKADRIRDSLELEMNTHANIIDIISEQNSEMVALDSAVATRIAPPEKTPAADQNPTATMMRVEDPTQISANSMARKSVPSISETIRMKADNIKSKQSSEVEKNEKYEDLKKSVQSIIDRTSASLPKVATGTPLQQKVVIETQVFLMNAEQALIEADAQIKTGNIKEANETMRTSERFARSAEALLKAGLKTDKKINKTKVRN